MELAYAGLTAQVALLGSFAVGVLTGDRGMAMLKPFVADLFPGALALFLLDMGLTAARRQSLPFHHHPGPGHHLPFEHPCGHPPVHTMARAFVGP